MKSLLFVPGDNPSMLQNAFVFESDKVIIDLEDAVSVENKDSARILVKQYLRICKNLEDVIVRINGLDTPYYIEDMKMLEEFEIHAVMVPKINVEVIEEFNSKYNYRILPIVESCMAVVQIPELVKYENIIGLLLGAEDLASDLEVSRSIDSLEILYPRQQLAYYCKAYNKIAVDTPTTSTTLMNVIENDALKAKQLGLKAKACIHPNQVPVVNSVFMVSEEEIIWAKRVLMAVEKNKGKGAFSLDSKMIDEPIIKRAKRFLSEAGENVE